MMEENKNSDILSKREINEIDPVKQLAQALDKEIINKSEFNSLTKVRQQVMEIIAVDDFPFDAFDRTKAQQQDDQSKVA